MRCFEKERKRMTVTIDVPPDMENNLRWEARQKGIEPQEAVFRLLEKHLPKPSYEADSEIPISELSVEAWNKIFDEYLASRPKNTPLLSEEAVSRASFYGERG